MVDCVRCELSRARTNVVPGEGPPDARVVFIGEGPGYNEDQQGRPFVGPAGQFLDELLALAGLRRSDVYICNVVKCRPPNNRDPLPTEISACKPWLDGQLRTINPQVIVTLGRFSMGRWFPGQSISRIHGRPVVRDGVTVVPMFHPAAALHQQSFRGMIEEDFKKLGALLAGHPPLASSPEPEPAPTVAQTPPVPKSVQPIAAEPQQLSMF